MSGHSEDQRQGPLRTGVGAAVRTSIGATMRTGIRAMVRTRVRAQRDKVPGHGEAKSQALERTTLRL